MLNYWFSSNDDICPDNYNSSRFKLKDNCRSENWEVYLYGDMSIMVERAQVQFLDSVTCPLCYDTAWSPVVQKTAEVSAVAAHDVNGKVFFFGPCTQVHGQGSPAIRAGKGWRGRRELAPRCSATQLGALRRLAGQTPLCLNH